MILTVYLAFFAVAVVILLLGVIIGENYFSFVALFFLFLLGNSLLFNGVDYQTGESTSLCNYEDTYVYGDNYSSYHWDYMTAPPVCNNPTDTSCINLFHTVREYNASCTETVTKVYTSLNDTLTWWFGFLLAIASAGGMAAILTQANRDFKAGKEYKRDYSGDGD